MKLGSSEAGTYPLEPNLPAKDLTTDNKSHWGYKYEFFFSTLDDPMDKPLFNTESRELSNVIEVNLELIVQTDVVS